MAVPVGLRPLIRLRVDSSPVIFIPIFLVMYFWSGFMEHGAPDVSRSERGWLSETGGWTFGLVVVVDYLRMVLGHI